MAEFCRDCSKKLNIKYDGFYEGEICEACRIVKNKKNKYF